MTSWIYSCFDNVMLRCILRDIHATKDVPRLFKFHWMHLASSHGKSYTKEVLGCPTKEVLGYPTKNLYI